MRVDNTTNISFGDKRNSIHITSKDQFKVGSVWIADFLHVPFGVSTNGPLGRQRLNAHLLNSAQHGLRFGL